MKQITYKERAMNMKVPQELVQEIANYLTRKPYAEVAAMIGNLVKCTAIEDEPTKEK